MISTLRTATSSQFLTGKKGLIILFEDGSKISKPQQAVKVKVGKGKYFDYKLTLRLSN